MDQVTLDVSDADEDTVEAVAVELWDVAETALDANISPEEILLAIYSLQTTIVQNFMTVESVH